MTVVVDPVTGAIIGARELMEEALASAIRAALTGRSTARSLLVSAAVPFHALDPIEWFAAAASLGEDAACWLEPQTHRSMVGVGTAASVTLLGPDRFRSAAAAWTGMLADSTVGGSAADQPGAGPILLGGATFAESASADACWAGFETGRLDVPAILLGTVDDASVLTCSLVVERSIDPRPAVSDLLDRVGQVAAAFEARSTWPSGRATRLLHQVDGHPDRATWSSSVARAAGAVGRGRIDKVVLARRVDFGAVAPIDVRAVLARLASSPSPTTEPGGAPVTVFAFSRGGRTFLGASPERLAAAIGRSFRTIALAGTTGRDPDPAVDLSLGTALLASEKDREEHAVVVEMLRETLAPLAAQLHVDRTPHVVRLPTLQHLATDISGDLHTDLGILDLVDRLHPTPAVGGWPRAAALELLEEQEHLDRGWYAGPVGWVDARGDGEFVVAIRSGVIAGDQAHLFVGCGIVADSEPDREWAESSMKLESLAMALGRLDPVTGYVTPAAPLRAFVAELVAAGVREAIVCPGSRSMPLALALRAHPNLRVMVHLDERAGAFMALGLAKASRRPVAILGTSGSAVVNFAPAVVEAHHGRVPLIVLTADRPPELRDRGAAQTIDQVRLYGSACKWYADLPVPEAGASAEALVRDVVARAVATAVSAPMGPVQVNLPYRASLLPDGPLAPGTNDPLVPHTGAVPAVRLPGATDLDRVAARVAACDRPLIVVGPLDRDGAAAAIARLAEAAGAPVVADALANLRLGPHDRSRVVARPGSLLQSPTFRSTHEPMLIVRLGATPTSAATMAFLEAAEGEQLVVDDGGWNLPTPMPVTMIDADPVAFADALTVRLNGMDGAAGPSWAGSWMEAGVTADAAVREALRGIHEPFEGGVFAELEGVLPDGTLLYVGSSMPVRDLDTFVAEGDARVRCVANRGVNGIDGVVSSALGAAAAEIGPVLLVVGDVAFVHDLNALVATRLHDLSATIVVIDNDGGGIFSFLPQGAARRPEIGLPEHYEELFGTPHGVDVLAVAHVLGAETAELEPGRIGETVADSLSRPGVRVLRLRTDRARNVVLHGQVQDAAREALG